MQACLSNDCNKESHESAIWGKIALATAQIALILHHAVNLFPNGLIKVITYMKVKLWYIKT